MFPDPQHNYDHAFGTLLDGFHRMEAFMKSTADTIFTRMDAMDGRFDQLDRRMDSVDGQLRDLNRRMDAWPGLHGAGPSAGGDVGDTGAGADEDLA